MCVLHEFSVLLLQDYKYRKIKPLVWGTGICLKQWNSKHTIINTKIAYCCFLSFYTHQGGQQILYNYIFLWYYGNSSKSCLLWVYPSSPLFLCSALLLLLTPESTNRHLIEFKVRKRVSTNSLQSVSRTHMNERRLLLTPKMQRSKKKLEPQWRGKIIRNFFLEGNKQKHSSMQKVG